jgi:hypothetical protein
VFDARNDRPAIALFHGLEGSTDRYYIIEMMQHLAALNYSVVAVNFRSCGSGMNRQRRFYHSGETEDYATVFSWMKRRFPASLLGAVGFSLGGNALLKSLGERIREEGLDHPVQAAVTVSVPYDLKAGSKRIHHGFNKVYERLFLKGLTAKLRKKREAYADLPHFEGASLYEFDNQVTAPVHGFEDADDYYARCSSNQFIPKINSPALLIHSKEDPICPVANVPLDAIRKNNALDYIITEKGGHVGFWSRPQGWLENVITNFFDKKFD